ncbi:MAG TPA: hypothetical protein VNI01_02550 [Elusimicrobiota bacterium]|nr:hypothetical protein [Elusimicrobiota bacterium]
MDAAERWLKLSPLERVALLRTLDLAAALRLFERLDEEQRLFLLCACEPGAAAPLLEGLGEAERAAFPPVPAGLREELERRALP